MHCNTLNPAKMAITLCWLTIFWTLCHVCGPLGTVRSDNQYNLWELCEIKNTDIAHLVKNKTGICVFFFKPTSSLEIVLIKQQNRPQKELLSRFWTDAQANLSLLSSLVSRYLPSLHSSSPVSYVHLCLQMRLQWWICGRSMSACLTLWCISTGLNPLSITLFRASFSFSAPLSLSLPFLSLSLLL